MNKKASGLLSSLGIKTPLSKIPLVGAPLFLSYKMNEIVNKFLLGGDKFMPEMYLRQSEFTYSALEHLLKTKKEYKNKNEKKAWQNSIVSKN